VSFSSRAQQAVYAELRFWAASAGAAATLRDYIEWKTGGGTLDRMRIPPAPPDPDYARQGRADLLNPLCTCPGFWRGTGERPRCPAHEQPGGD
jgi:hypothetical protein